MSCQKIIHVISCIDFRYDELVCNYFTQIGLDACYYNSTTAGAGLPLGYYNSCKQLCCAKGCKPCNCDIQTLKKSLDLNLTISRSLSDIKCVYVLNHQDCGAFKAFIGCSGYPDTLGEDNAKEIKINENVLNNAKKYLLKNNKDICVRLGVIDTNDSVADYDPCTKKWTLQYQGTGTDPKGLWYDYPFDN